MNAPRAGEKRDLDNFRNRLRLSWFATQGQGYSVDVAGKVLRDDGGIASGSGDFALAWAPTPPLIGNFIPFMSR